jgi:hypothetical protein
MASLLTTSRSTDAVTTGSAVVAAHRERSELQLRLSHDRAVLACARRALGLDVRLSLAGTAAASTTWTESSPSLSRAHHNHAAQGAYGIAFPPPRVEDLHQFGTMVSVPPGHTQYLYARHLHRIEHEQMRDRLAPSSSSGLLGRVASVGLQTTTTAPRHLPVVFADATDSLILSAFQALLRQQIELFAATENDLSSCIRGRNKKIGLGQVGIRCRHCAHVPAARRTKGSVYFPATILGLYQAAQNMSSNHIQCGLCPEMTDSLKNEFTKLFPTKTHTSGGGRMYWAESAKRLGMTDSDHGIRFTPYHG